jgi:hypothetical protein
MTSNILILCHGMTIKPEPAHHNDEYEPLLEGIWNLYPQLKTRFNCIVPVEYGHEMPRGVEGALRPDEKLTRAQRFIQQRIAYERIVAAPSPEDELLPPSSEFASLLLRAFTGPVRDIVFTLGMTDALYYASSDGEREIRTTVYEQVLNALETCNPNSDIRLHIVAHSLGATIMFDFLYGLFRKDVPERTVEKATLESRSVTARYLAWRDIAQGSKSKLKLASYVTLGGQIPFFFMRKQTLVEQFARQERLEPDNIGVPKSGKPVWKIFYDVDDVFGYPVRGLFNAHGTIRQYQVNTGALPHQAHTLYWNHPKVLAEVGTLLLQNSTPSEVVLSQ